MTHDGRNTLTYDAESRVRTNVYQGQTSTYTYDAGALRVKKVAGSTTTRYIFAGAKVIAEYENGASPSAPTREYVYAGGQLVATHEGLALRYHHADHLSVRVTTDTSGAKIGEQGHFPFGESWYTINTTNKMRFTSYERDSESGNDFALFRYHMNRLGRFNAPDAITGSIADPQSLNRYTYVRNDPVNLIDPLGLQQGKPEPELTPSPIGLWETTGVHLILLYGSPAGVGLGVYFDDVPVPVIIGPPTLPDFDLNRLLGPQRLPRPPGECGVNPLTGQPGLGGTTVTSPFGPRTHPITGARQQHRGADLAAAAGSNLYPILPGTITAHGENDTAGVYITVQISSGPQTYYYQYLHLNQAVVLPVEVGQGLNDQPIAQSGATGSVTAAHLHLQIYRLENGQRVFLDPVQFLTNPCPW